MGRRVASPKVGKTEQLRGERKYLTHSVDDDVNHEDSADGKFWHTSIFRASHSYQLLRKAKFLKCKDPGIDPSFDAAIQCCSK